MLKTKRWHHQCLRLSVDIQSLELTRLVRRKNRQKRRAASKRCGNNKKKKWGLVEFPKWLQNASNLLLLLLSLILSCRLSVARICAVRWPIFAIFGTFTNSNGLWWWWIPQGRKKEIFKPSRAEPSWAEPRWFRFTRFAQWSSSAGEEQEELCYLEMSARLCKEISVIIIMAV